MSIEAMKQALEALRCIESPLHVWEINKLAGAMNALHQAIEQAEKQEPVGYLYDWLNPDNRDEVIRDWFAASTYVIEKDKGFNVRPLYTAPLKREWVGLTDGEMQEAMEYWSDSLRSSYGGAESASEEYVDMVLTWRYIEAKLKEKNNGMLQSGL
jgi:hypothetical protein